MIWYSPYLDSSPAFHGQVSHPPVTPHTLHPSETWLLSPARFWNSSRPDSSDLTGPGPISLLIKLGVISRKLFLSSASVTPTQWCSSFPTSSSFSVSLTHLFSSFSLVNEDSPSTSFPSHCLSVSKQFCHCLGLQRSFTYANLIHSWSLKPYLAFWIFQFLCPIGTSTLLYGLSHFQNRPFCVLYPGRWEQASIQWLRTKAWEKRSFLLSLFAPLGSSGSKSCSVYLLAISSVHLFISLSLTLLNSDLLQPFSGSSQWLLGCSPCWELRLSPPA